MDHQKPPEIVQPADDAAAMARRLEEKAMEKIDAMLVLDFERSPGQGQGVIVWFTTLPDDETLEAMELRSVPPNKATGHLTKAQIEALARRPDVRQIRSRPQPKAL